MSLKLEAFESNEATREIEFFSYQAQSNSMEKGREEFMRGVCKAIFGAFKTKAFTDDRRIFTLQEISAEEFNKNKCGRNAQIEFEKKETLDVLQYKKIYCDLILEGIKENLKNMKVNFQNGSYPKYSVGKEITSAWFCENNSTVVSKDKEFRLRRKFSPRIEIADDKKAILFLGISHEIETKETLADLISKGKNIIGMEARHIWNRDIAQTGKVVRTGPETVCDKLDFCTSLKDYYQNGDEQKRAIFQKEKLFDLPDTTPVIWVCTKTKKEIPYYPQSLKRCVRLENVAFEDATFSKLIKKFHTIPMDVHKKIDEEFILDIGNLQTPAISFEKNFCEVERLGFSQKKFSLPLLTCAKGCKISAERISKVFENGFVKQPPEPIKFAFVYPKNQVELMRSFFVCLRNFLKNGNLVSNEKYIKKNLVDSDFVEVANAEYEIGNAMEYKSLVRDLSNDKSKKFDVAIVLVPDEKDEDGDNAESENPYGVFKTEWAKQNIPSQMICVKTAREFQNDSKNKNANSNSIYKMQNIALGILAKAGGVPWVVEGIPGGVDCFVGLDVSTQEKGIHFPSCATVCDFRGQFISMYKPKTAQKGEKIGTEILQEIFDEVLISFKEHTGDLPKNIVIHRDGFSREDAAWYEKYFSACKIDFSIVEVKKFFAERMLFEDGDTVKNPEIGSAVLSAREAYIVTTNSYNGSPRPVRIKIVAGKIKIEDAIEQVLALSFMHYGSTRKPRLPVTTLYADKICKNARFVPEGLVGDRLFFL